MTKHPRVLNTKMNVVRIARNNLVVDKLNGGIVGGGCKMKNFDMVGGGGSNGGISEVVGGGGCKMENFDRVGGGDSNGGIIEVVEGGRNNNNNNNYTDHPSVKLNNCRNTTINKVEDNEELSLVYSQDINYNDKHDETNTNDNTTNNTGDDDPDNKNIIDSNDNNIKSSILTTKIDNSVDNVNHDDINNNNIQSNNNNNDTTITDTKEDRHHPIITNHNSNDNNDNDTTSDGSTALYINANNNSAIDNITMKNIGDNTLTARKCIDIQDTAPNNNMNSALHTRNDNFMKVFNDKELLPINHKLINNNSWDNTTSAYNINNISNRNAPFFNTSKNNVVTKNNKALCDISTT